MPALRWFVAIVLSAFRVIPQPGVPPEEAGTAVAAESSTGTWTTVLVAEVLEKNNLPGAIFTSFCGGAEIAQGIVKDTRIALVSFTGSSKGGRRRWQGKFMLFLRGTTKEYTRLGWNASHKSLGIQELYFSHRTFAEAEREWHALQLRSNIYKVGRSSQGNSFIEKTESLGTSPRCLDVIPSDGNKHSKHVVCGGISLFLALFFLFVGNIIGYCIPH